MSVANHLRAFGVSASEVGREVGVTRQTIHNWFKSGENSLLEAAVDLTIKRRNIATASDICAKVNALASDTAAVSFTVDGGRAVFLAHSGGRVAYRELQLYHGVNPSAAATHVWLTLKSHLSG